MIRKNITGSGFITIGLWGNSNLVVEEGTGYFSLSNGKVVSKGKYLLVWKKGGSSMENISRYFFPDGKSPN